MESARDSSCRAEKQDSLEDQLGEDPSGDTKGGREDDADLRTNKTSAREIEEDDKGESSNTHIPQRHLVRRSVLDDENQMGRQSSKKAVVG